MPSTRPAEELVANADLMQAVRAELDRMPEKQRLPVHLRYFAELDYPEIAEALGCSVNNARVRVHRSLAVLRNRLAQIGLFCSLAMLLGRLDAAVAAGWCTPSPAGAADLARWQALLKAPLTCTITGSAPGSIPLIVGIGTAVAAGLAATVLWWNGSGTSPEDTTMDGPTTAAIDVLPRSAPAPAPALAATPTQAPIVDPAPPPTPATKLPETRITMGPGFEMSHDSRFVIRRSLRILREGSGVDARYTVIDGEGTTRYRGPWNRRILGNLGLTDEQLDRLHPGP